MNHYDIAKILYKKPSSVLSKLKTIGHRISNKKRILWTDQDVATLIELAPNKTAKELSTIFDRSPTSIGCKLKYLGLSSKPDKHPGSGSRPKFCWILNLASREYLIENFSDNGAVVCAKHLGMPIDFIRKEASKLGLRKKHPGTFTEIELNYIRDNVSNIGLGACSVALQRPKEMIRINARRLGIKDLGKGSRVQWSTKDDRFISKNIGPMGTRWVAQQLGRKPDGVRQRAIKLCVYKGRSSRSDHLIALHGAFIADNYGKQTQRWCAEQIGIDVKQVEYLVKKLGLQKPKLTQLQTNFDIEELRTQYQEGGISGAEKYLNRGRQSTVNTLDKLGIRKIVKLGKRKKAV
ncbi:hypothetical protein [Pseudomonas sp. 2FE]|uniref:hypothetical protein n=1 Tax=Pseudomonas sp. 2FE TaxID=2502190 RepID=UPI0010F4697A|nr:hypothetical protein [Pseudomonas sp. 2FE]